MQKLNIDIICVGKIKQASLANLLGDYQTRIGKYAKFNIIELKDFSDDNIEKTLQKEKELILPYLDSNNYNIVCGINGKSFSSEKLATHLSNMSMQYKKIIFIIGGSHGLAQEVYDQANLVLSFSELTFPHQLFRLMLLEQIYRTLNILNNTPYHK